MPFVQGYFRSAPGGGGHGLLDRRRIDVAVYGADGTTLLRDNTGGRWNVSNITFGSTLPGGFATASFRLARPTVRAWAGRAGLKVIIRRGNQVLWWGWIEDIRRVIRGATEYMDVTCIGPYQVIQQRLCSPNYSATIYGQQALALELALNCPDIAGDYDGLTATGVDLHPLSWSNRPIADLVKLVCEAGNSSGQPMLFAIWEPQWFSFAPVSILSNATFSWGFTPWTDNDNGGAEWLPAQWPYYHSAPYAVRAEYVSGAGSPTLVQTASCNAATDYFMDFWTRFTTSGGNTVSVYYTLDWKNAGGGAISTTTGTTRSATVSTGWLHYTEAATSPALAASVVVTLHVSIPNVAGAICYLDDVYLYEEQTPILLPKAYLWARDLTDYDYQLYTAELDSALPVDTTTRDLANNVLASYGASSYTAAAESSTSQTRYRQRDGLVAAGTAASATVAAAMRDTYLARHAEPQDEPGSFRLSRPGALRTGHGQVVWPEDVRAGDRIVMADGPLAGTVVLLKSVEYNDGVVTCTPERGADVPQLLARV